MSRSNSSVPRWIAPPQDAAVRYGRSFRRTPMTRTEQNTRIATLKQLADAFKETKHGGRYVLTNSQLYTVRVCGRLVSIDQEDGHARFVIDDGTATVQGIIQSYHVDGHTDLSGSLLGAYYVVVANVRAADNNIELQALKAWKVLNYNEITLHFLSAIHEYCDLGSVRVSDIDHWNKAMIKATSYAQTKLNDEINKEAIVSLLSAEDVRASADGAPTQYIMERLHMDEPEARSTLASLLDEGSIYNTIDYNHFKMADDI